ncbi:MAG: hypothetical protein ABEK50_03500, partial [bacterium]
ALSEAARIVRGDIRDMRAVEADDLFAAVFVGGGGTLSTWTDYHKRGQDCRVTERLKYQVLDLFRAEKPMVGFGNAAFVLARILADPAEDLTINIGSNAQLNQALEEWGVTTDESTPSWDSHNQVGSLPDVVKTESLPELKGEMSEILDRALV